MGKLKWDSIDEKAKIQFLRDIIQLLEDNNMEYFLIFGSLLGCIREGKIIDGDSDIDIAIFDLDDILRVKKEFEGKGLFVETVKKNRYSFSKDVKYHKSIKITKKEFNTFSADLFVLEKKNETYIARFVWRINIISRLMNVISSSVRGKYYKQGVTNPKTMRKIGYITNFLPKRTMKLFDKIEHFFGKKHIVLFQLGKTIYYKMYDDMNVKVPINYEEFLVQTYGEKWRIPDKNFTTSSGKYFPFAEKRGNIYITNIGKNKT